MSRVIGGGRHGGRWLAAGGALYAAASVALAAYAAHAALPSVQSQLQLAAVFAFGHGIALASLAMQPHSRLTRAALHLLWVGVLLFSGSLAGNALAGLPTVLAPAGGMLLIAGWLLYAAALLRRKGDA